MSHPTVALVSLIRSLDEIRAKATLLASDDRTRAFHIDDITAGTWAMLDRLDGHLIAQGKMSVADYLAARTPMARKLG